MNKYIERATYSLGTPLDLAWHDFMLSRKIKCRSRRTVEWYELVIGRFIGWLFERIDNPINITAIMVHEYLDEFKERGGSENYINNQARAIKTFTLFLCEEKYIRDPIKFKMPPPSKEEPEVLTIDEIRHILTVCNTRDKALFMVMVDSGVRSEELISLRWEDVDLSTGVIYIQRGKGGKSRHVMIGVNTRRALLSYARAIALPSQGPLFQTRNGDAFTTMGLRSVLRRISEKAKVHIHPHLLRRTFATLCVEAGMDQLELQGLLGHTTLEMTRRYVRLGTNHLERAHREHGPIDKLVKKRL